MLLQAFQPVIEILTYIFALYGFILAISLVVKCFYRGISLGNSDIRIVLIVKNQGEMIEGVVRSILSSRIFEGIIHKDSLYIVNMGSNDNTGEILHRLKRDYDCYNMVVLNNEEKDKVFDGFSDAGGCSDIDGCDNVGGCGLHPSD
jgi:hypothetical protein